MHLKSAITAAEALNVPTPTKDAVVEMFALAENAATPDKDNAL